MISGLMLADFAVRVAFGLSIALLLTSWREVPPPFFRTVLLVALGLLVLAALDQARDGGKSLFWWLVVAAALFSYLGAVAWGLGLPALGRVTCVFVSLATACWLAVWSSSSSEGLWALNALSRLASGLVIGSTLMAMLLGHHYLTAPTMSIDPLKRSVAISGCVLAARAVLAGVGMYLAPKISAGTGVATLLPGSGLFLTARWGLGFVGAAIGTYLAWKTVQLRSTQSATGILYIIIIFVLFGELTSLILAGRGGVIW
jgi:hypothetical protein